MKSKLNVYYTKIIFIEIQITGNWETENHENNRKLYITFTIKNNGKTHRIAKKTRQQRMWSQLKNAMYELNFKFESLQTGK